MSLELRVVVVDGDVAGESLLDRSRDIYEEGSLFLAAELLPLLLLSQELPSSSRGEGM